MEPLTPQEKQLRGVFGLPPELTATEIAEANLRAEQLGELAASADAYARADVACHPNTSPETRAQLAADPDPFVARTAVLHGASLADTRPDWLATNGHAYEWLRLAVESGNATVYAELSRTWTGSAASLVQAVRDGLLRSGSTPTQ